MTRVSVPCGSRFQYTMSEYGGARRLHFGVAMYRRDDYRDNKLSICGGIFENIKQSLTGGNEMNIISSPSALEHHP